MIFVKSFRHVGRFSFLSSLMVGVFLFLSPDLFAQISGVSASKLTATDGNLVSPKTLEAEPSFSYLYGKKAFDNQGNLYSVSLDNDSAVISKDLFFRFTYGVNKRLEIGTFITADLNSISFGAKYRFVQHKKFLAAALLGVNFSNVLNSGLRKSGFFGRNIGIATGVALTNNFTSRFSLDISTQYQNTFCNEGSISDDYFLDSDLGYYVFNGTLQLIGGLSFQYNHFKNGDPDAYRLSLHPGVTIETGKSFIIVFYTPIDIVGKNMGRFTGFSFAFTFTID